MEKTGEREEEQHKEEEEDEDEILRKFLLRKKAIAYESRLWLEEHNKKLIYECPTTVINLFEDDNDYDHDHDKNCKISSVVDQTFIGLNEVVTKFYQFYYSNKENGFILTAASRAEGNECISRIFNLFQLKKQYESCELNIEQLETKILQLYKTNPYFYLQIEMRKAHYFLTPALGLCWLISEYQAFYRGKSDEANSNVETWKKYAQDLGKILQEGYDLIKKQIGDGYSEANKIERMNERNTIEATHNHFIQAWEHPEIRAKLLKDGIYSNDIPDIFKTETKNSISYKVDENNAIDMTVEGTYDGPPQKVHGRWGGMCGFGTVFFTGYGLENAPPLNYFINNECLFNDKAVGMFRLKNYARLCLLLPSSFLTTKPGTLRCFSLDEIANALKHNNSILYSRNHYQPIEWPSNLLNTHFELSVVALVKETKDIICSKWSFDCNVTESMIAECLKTIVSK